MQKKLGELFELNYQQPKAEFNSEKVITVKLHGKGVVKNKKTSTLKGGSSYFIRKEGEFIFSKIDFLNGAFGIVPKELDNFISSSDVPSLRFNNTVNPNYFIFWLSLNYKKLNIERVGTSDTLKRISKKKLLEIPLLIPTLPEQQKIAACLSSLDELITAQTKKIELLEQHKKGLLQGLFPNVNGNDNG